MFCEHRVLKIYQRLTRTGAVMVWYGKKKSQHNAERRFARIKAYFPKPRKFIILSNSTTTASLVIVCTISWS